MEKANDKKYCRFSEFLDIYNRNYEEGDYLKDFNTDGRSAVARVNKEDNILSLWFKDNGEYSEFVTEKAI